MPSPSQIRAARGLLDWSQKDLAERAGVTEATVRNAEKEGATPNSKTLAAIERAFGNESIQFYGDKGLEKREGNILQFVGQKGFMSFMNDVYEESLKRSLVKEEIDICVTNVDERNWEKWLPKEFAESYRNKMASLSKLKSKILIKEGDCFATASKFAEYRSVPSDVFYENISYYVYGDRLALIQFTDKDVLVYILEDKKFADSFRMMFSALWNGLARAL